MIRTSLIIFGIGLIMASIGYILTPTTLDSMDSFALVATVPIGVGLMAIGLLGIVGGLFTRKKVRPEPDAPKDEKVKWGRGG